MVDTEQPREYLILADSMERLVERFEAIVRRARRLGVEVPNYETVRTHTEWEMVSRRKTQDEREWRKSEKMPEGTARLVPTGVCRVVNHVVLVGAQKICLAGWTFLAVLDMEMGAENVIVRPIPGASVPAHYRTTGNICNHCGHRRYRRQTFVVEHTSGEMKVGSSCLHDFLGHDATAVMAAVEMMTSIHELLEGGEDDDELGGAGRNPSTFDLATYLTFVIDIIRSKGWTSRKEAEIHGCSATADLACTAIVKASESGSWRRARTTGEHQDDYALATEVVAWMASLADQEDLSDHLYNLSIYGRTGRVNFKGMGVAASAVVAYRRDLAKKKLRETLKDSKYIGAIGEKFYGQVTLVACVPTNSTFGTSWLHRFVTIDGNLLTAFVQREIQRHDEHGVDHEIEDDEVFWLSGKIKAHREFNGVLETQLSHCDAALSPEELARVKASSKRTEVPAGEYEIDGVKYPVFDIVRADGEVIGFVVRSRPEGKKKQGVILGKVEYGARFAESVSAEGRLNVYDHETMRQKIAALAAKSVA
jgi:hypothetical protein